MAEAHRATMTNGMFHGQFWWNGGPREKNSITAEIRTLIMKPFLAIGIRDCSSSQTRSPIPLGYL